MVDYFKEGTESEKKINKKKILITSIISILLITIGIVSAIYISNRNFRDWIDSYILRKNIQENDASFIELNAEENPQVYAYDKYIAILNRNTLSLYNHSGKTEKDVKVEVSSPIFESNNRFLAVAQKEGNKIYLLSGKDMVWEKEVEGSINRVHVNKNGYVSVILSGTTYKTVIVTFNPDGTELFKNFLSKSRAIDVCISNDNKYLAVAEINTSGSLIQSRVKIFSMEKAQSETEKENAELYTYTPDNDELIINVKYQEKGKLVCLYYDCVKMIQEGKEEELFNTKDQKVIFADIELTDFVVKVVEKSTGLFKASAVVELMNVSTKKENIYTLDSVPKSIYCYDNVIAINLGTEVHFINTNGWLVKKYISSQEVKNIIMCSNIAGIVYRDKIEIIHL